MTNISRSLFLCCIVALVSAVVPGAVPRAGTMGVVSAAIVAIPRGTFRIGMEGDLPNEKPLYSVRIAPFPINKHAVTVARFATFVEDTGADGSLRRASVGSSAPNGYALSNIAGNV